MADQSLDSRRIAREQERSMAASAAVGLNAAKPLIQFQSAMLRVCSEGFELAAQNYEKSMEAFSSLFDPQMKSDRETQ